MGNRAVIVFESMPTVGIYLHWNGGPESVLAFLEATKRRGARSPDDDATYGFARLVQTIADFMSQDGDYELSIGVGPLALLDTDNGDNGTYWVGPDWKVIRREHNSESDRALQPSALDTFRRNGYPSQHEQYESILEAVASLTHAEGER